MSLTRELMGDKSKIEWTDATWNPIRARNKATGGVGHFCEKVSAGCKHCYAERMQPRFKNPIAYGPQSLDQVELFLDEEVLLQPLRWKRPRMIFVGSMTDLFGHWVPDAWLDRIWAVMALCPQHTFQVVTKRPERMAGYFQNLQKVADQHAPDTVTKYFNPTQVLNIRFLAAGGGRSFAHAPWPLPNVWLLTSVEDQATANARIPHLLECPAVVRGLSVEPLLGAVDLSMIDTAGGDRIYPLRGYVGAQPMHRGKAVRGACTRINWVIVGGESGPQARPMQLAWVRSLRDQCAQAGVAFFFKQWGEWAPHPHVGGVLQSHGNVDLVLSAMLKVGKHAAGRLLDGVEHNGLPTLTETT